jgi:hypothetical protein
MGPPTQEIAVIGCKTLVLSMGGYGSTTWRALSDQGPLQGCLMVNTFFVRKGFELVHGFVLARSIASDPELPILLLKYAIYVLLLNNTLLFPSPLTPFLPSFLKSKTRAFLTHKHIIPAHVHNL